MALIQCNFFSQILGMSSCMTVLLPDQEPPEGGFGVLYLLHGHSDDHTAWCRNTGLERYVGGYPLAVVMPDAHRSFYCDSEGSHAYFSFLTGELPSLARRFFPISGDRARSFIAGNSMGGYGALRAALTCPEQYEAAVSLSGAFYPLETLYGLGDFFTVKDFRQNLTRIFGKRADFDSSPHSLERLAVQCAAGVQAPPRILLAVGREDFFYTENRRFHSYLTEHAPRIPLLYMERDGDHSWTFWDGMVREILEFCTQKARIRI